MNQTCLIGRLTKEVELKYTPSNVANVSFTLAVNRTFKNANGEREADFINCVIWRKSAENFANWVKKGALIGITGRIQTRNYENEQGKRVYITEVVADSFQMLESNNKEKSKAQNKPQEAKHKPNSIPNFGKDSDPFSSKSPLVVDDDSLPF